MPNTLYSILGLDDDATLDDITRAYQVRKQKLEHDMDPDSQNELKLAQQAFSILSNPTQREKYDLELKERAARDSAAIYHMNDARQAGGRKVVRLLLLFAVLLVGYLAYQHYSTGQAHAVVQAGASQAKISPDAAASQQ
jgi:DnaJ-class molecular chaperone